jgi:tartrate-resistant acid phosphatase type 5
MRSMILIFSLTMVVFSGFCQDETKPYYDNDDVVVKKPFKFIVFGDWGRNGEDNQKKVAKEMGVVAKKFKPEFIISTGDNFYPDGVRSTRDHSWIASYEDIYTAHSLQTDWYVVLGNHDYGGDPQAEIDYSLIDRKWNMPARYYAKIFYINGDTTQGLMFVFLDTTPFLTEYYNNGEKTHVQGQDTAAQRLWLENTLRYAPPNIKWKFVFGHHPVYTGGGRMNAVETGEMKKLFKPIFEKYKVNAYICGHDHNLQYIKPQGYTYYFVSGAGSELSKTIVHPEGGVFAKAENGFMTFSISNNSMLVNVMSYTGEKLFTTTLKRQ